MPAGVLRQPDSPADFLLTPGEADIGFKWRCERFVASSSNKVNVSRRLPGTASLLRGLGSFERFMDESQAKGGGARACCVVILEKGKPVARPGRKARERSTLCWSAASPVAEGMLARHKRRSRHHGSRDETQKALFINRLGRKRSSAGSFARRRAERNCPSQPPGAVFRKLPTTSRA